MIQVIQRVNLALHVALLGTGRTGGLQIPLRVSLPVNEIELQLYRYHREHAALAQCLPNSIQDITGFNVKGSTIFIQHGQ
ncbi:hypothetical protein D3C78_1036320 [compost metagenome]